ncbi:hypothetical protein [Maribacter sp. 2304DJ31-5]|uniref:hypothetical protein n=1 Tax=Maribacter sp. 2304DJ31-5 TaxID=3386273 RepID=UPI0039BD917F
MNTQKLSLHEFEAVGKIELLKTKGGLADGAPIPLPKKYNNRGASGSGGIDNCPRCDSRRCNGSSHSNTNVQSGTYAATGSGIFSAGTGGNPLAAIGAFVVGSLSDFFLDNQIGDYYGNYSTQGTGSKVDIWADAYGYNTNPNTFGGMHNNACGGRN